MNEAVGNPGKGKTENTDTATRTPSVSTPDFESIVRETLPRLLALARRYLRNEDDARDCVQEALLAGHDKFEEFEGRASIATWLHRIVVNKAISKLRVAARLNEQSLDAMMPTFDEDDFLFGPTSTTPLSADELFEQSSTRQAVRDAIGQLPEIHRAILLLRDVEEYNTAEVAERLGIQVSAAKTRLHRARTALRVLLEPVFREESS